MSKTPVIAELVSDPDGGVSHVAEWKVPPPEPGTRFTVTSDRWRDEAIPVREIHAWKYLDGGS